MLSAGLAHANEEQQVQSQPRVRTEIGVQTLAYNYLDGIDGEHQTDNVNDWIEIFSFSWMRS
jgi:hypothetical protein